jgi:hypothetical protein
VTVRECPARGYEWPIPESRVIEGVDNQVVCVLPPDDRVVARCDLQTQRAQKQDLMEPDDVVDDTRGVPVRTRRRASQATRCGGNGHADPSSARW